MQFYPPPWWWRSQKTFGLTESLFKGPVVPALAINPDLAGTSGWFKIRLAMKSAYELAMERLQKNAPTVSLTEDQKKQLAEVDSSFKAKIAEREVFLKDQILKAQTSGKFDEIEPLQKQLALEVRRLQEDCEDKKEKLRKSFAG